METEDLPATDGQVREQEIHMRAPEKIGDGHVVFLAQVSGPEHTRRDGGENGRTWSGRLGPWVSKEHTFHISGVQIDRSHCRFIERIVVCMGDGPMRWNRSTVKMSIHQLEGEGVDSWHHYDASHDLLRSEKMETEAVSE